MGGDNEREKLVPEGDNTNRKRKRTPLMAEKMEDELEEATTES